MLDDANETYVKNVHIAGDKKPVSVLFGNVGAFICEGKGESAKEIYAGLANSIPYKNGYSYIDVTNEETSYRAYFKLSNIHSDQDATYLFCSGAGSELSGMGCVLSGVFPRGCFEAYISKANTLEYFDRATLAVDAVK